MLDDERSLLAATAADPADDLARLVYADFREESGADNYARFIREQVRLDPLPDWHPDRVRAKYRDPDLLTGAAFARELPTPPTRAWEWPTTGAFRRGLPYAVVVRDLTGFLDIADELFEQYPIGELHLPTSTLDEWRRFARRPWLPRVERVRFYGVSTPIEPLRVLADAPGATGLTVLAMEKASGPAVPVLLADLFDAPLGRRLRRLELHAGANENLEWLDALGHVREGDALRDLSLVTMGVTADVAVRLMGLPAWRGVTRFESRHNPIGTARVWAPVFAGLASLSAVAGQVGTTEAAESIASGIGAACRELDLSHNPLHLGRFPWPAESQARPRCLRLRRCNLLPPAAAALARSAAWPGLVELDLRGNALYSGGLAHLLAADPPPGLVALVLEAGVAGTAPGKRLRDKYGAAVVFTDAE